MGIALPAAPPTLAPISLERALTDESLLATFVLSAFVPPGWTEPANIGKLAGDGVADQVATILAQPTLPFGQRAIFWAADPRSLCTGDVKNPAVMVTGFGLTTDGSTISGSQDIPLTPTLQLHVASGAALSLNGDVLTLSATPSNPNLLQFVGSSSPAAGDVSTVATATLPFTDDNAASLQFGIQIARRSFGASGLRWGFQCFIPSGSGDVGAYYPLASVTDGPGDRIGFDVAIDPSDTTNRTLPARTTWSFTGDNDDDSPTTLASNFRTAAGHGVRFTPSGASLVFHDGSPDAPFAERFVLGPRGDFTVDVPAETTPHHDLMCGLAGTETISFMAGDTIEFTAEEWKHDNPGEKELRDGPAAYAAAYPWPESSPTGAPVDPAAPLLTSKYSTSYASVRSANERAGAAGTNGIHYSAQPTGFNLYGNATTTNDPAGHSALLWAKSPGVELGASHVFPLLPYAGTSPSQQSRPPDGLDAATLFDLESRGISPTRRAAISSTTTSPSKAFTLGLTSASADDNAYLASTPSGLIVKVDGGDYNWVLLGQNGGTSGIQMKFCNPSRPLFDALQSSSLFLVSANNDDDVLGELQGWGATQGGSTPACDGTTSQFFNAMSIGTGADAWAIQADVGACNHYGDYSNVLIVKGRPGKLADLVRNPSLWTQRAVFGSPSDLPNGVACGAGTPRPADPGELVALSGWMQDYIADAIAQADDPDNPDRSFFQKFKQIAESETWTGVLVLKATVAQVPKQLAGLVAGIDRTHFNVHHFGIAISPIEGTKIEITDTSSMFGLIHYVDPVYRVLQTSPIPPTAGAAYDFKVLTLKVLFDNSAVKDFRSLAQATLNTVFDQPVTKMGNPANTYNSIMLNGSFQKQGNQTLYTLETTGDNTFYFDSNVMNKVEVVKAQFATVSETPRGGETVIDSRLSMWGFIDFKVMEQQPQGGNSLPSTPSLAVGPDAEPLVLDVLSYGNQPGQDLARKGLRFSGLALAMTDIEPPVGSPDPPQRTLTFDTSKVVFDPRQSTPRPESAAVQLALKISGFSGSGQRATSRNGGSGPKPGDLGYLNVGSGVRLGGVADVWNGIVYRVEMGTPGNLAGDVGLTSELLVAWSPTSVGSSYVAALGIKLPGTGGGAKLLSIEGVLRVSIGRVELCRVPSGKPGAGAYVLVLDDIALKFLGLLKLPPSGNTSFRLFGKPGTVGQPDPTALGWLAMYAQSSGSSGGDSAVTLEEKTP